MLNKVDLLPDDEREQCCREVVEALDWQGSVFSIAAISQRGTGDLCTSIIDYLEECWEAEAANPELAEQESQRREQMQQEARDRIEGLRTAHRADKSGQADDDEDDDRDDDDYDVEVVYTQE